MSEQTETEVPTIEFVVDGLDVSVPDDGASLLGTLRDRLGNRSPKDGCSPQGQCGCCTVLVDGQPRVACVTPTRRVAGRTITTLDGFAQEEQQRWANAFCATGASQCGFCTPGIIVRLAGLEAKKPDATKADVDKALAAHLCRCTGWQTIHEAWDIRHDPPEIAASTSASITGSVEGGVAQSVGTEIALGRGGFADDSAPEGAPVAVRASDGSWAVGNTLHHARQLAGKVQGRRTTRELSHPIDLPAGEWAASLQTTWTEPGYLETDASWAQPNSAAISALGNAGAFGSKTTSPAPATAAELADEHHQAIRVLLSREDTVRLGPKRPPVAGGANPDGTGLLRIAATSPQLTEPRYGCSSIDELVALFAPGIELEHVETPGPPTSADIRGAVWAEAVCLAAMAQGELRRLEVPGGPWAHATVDETGIMVHASSPAGLATFDRTVLRSYCIGAAHMATSLVRSESLTVDEAGEVHDLTIRSFGILKASETPPVDIEFTETGIAHEHSISDLVFAAVAAATSVHLKASQWPADH